jgi:HK97 gp10 family phage protein
MSKFVDIKIDKDLTNLAKNEVKGVVRFLEKAGDLTENEVKKLPQKASYVDRTGNLRQSIKRDKVNKRDLSVKVVAGMEYGEYVNDGTIFIRARKFLEQGLNKASRFFERMLKNELDKTM